MALKYEALTWSGEKVKGVLDTDSEEVACKMLHEEALIPWRLTPATSRLNLEAVMPRLFPPTTQELIEFTQQTASLITSGIPLVRALAAHRDHTQNIGLKSALRNIVEDIESGSRLSGALSRHPRVFPEFYIRLLRVGEASGGLAVSLEGLARSLKRRKAVRDRVKRALTYPALSLAIAAVAALVLVKYSLPALVGMLEEFGGELPRMTRLLIAMTDWLQAYIGYALPGVAVMVAVVLVASRGKTVKRWRDGMLLKAPLVGRVSMSSNMFFLTSTLATLLKAGLPTIEALRLTEHGLSNSVLREKLGRVTTETSNGSKLGQAIINEGGFPPLLSQAISTGEVKGTQTDTLQGLADYYEQQTENSVAGATEMIQPIVTLLVAGVVGFVAVAIISGIYSTLSSVR